MARCQAKSKRSGVQCKRYCPPGSRVCYYHGSRSKKGIAAPNFKTGKYSKYLPANLLERYNAAKSDQDLLELREEIALTDARLADLLTRIDKGEGGALWRRARELFADFRKANQAQDRDKMEEALIDLGRVLDKGSGDYAIWSDINQVIEQRRRLVESERKRLVEMQQLITAEQALGLIAGLAQIVKKYVTDSTTIDHISEELTRFAYFRSGPVLETGPVPDSE